MDFTFGSILTLVPAGADVVSVMVPCAEMPMATAAARIAVVMVLFIRLKSVVGLSFIT